MFDVVRDECLAVRERVGILDLSGFAKYDVSGPDAESFLYRICANKIPTRAGGITLTHVLSGQGRIGGEMTVTRLADDSYYVLSAAGAEMRDLDHLVQGKLDSEDAVITNVTDDRGVLVLAGPDARDVLSRQLFTPLPGEELPAGRRRRTSPLHEKLQAQGCVHTETFGWERPKWFSLDGREENYSYRRNTSSNF